jgi:hypothetical protein
MLFEDRSNQRYTGSEMEIKFGVGRLTVTAGQNPEFLSNAVVFKADSTCS